MSLRVRIGQWVEGSAFQRFITVLIIANGISLGLETWDAAVIVAGFYLRAFDAFVLTMFVFEIAGKLVYRGKDFFRSGWNVFDFIVVGIALLPATGPLAVLRALRILRILRLLSVVPALRKVVEALLHAVPGLLSVMTIILLFFYVGAVLSTKLFGAAFDLWFGTVGQSMYTLFQIMTLESWSMGIVRPVMEVYPYAWLFFVPFIIATSFAILNLFIGIIVEAMQATHRAEEQEGERQAAAARGELLQEIQTLRYEISELKTELAGNVQRPK